MKETGSARRFSVGVSRGYKTETNGEYNYGKKLEEGTCDKKAPATTSVKDNAGFVDVF